MGEGDRIVATGLPARIEQTAVEPGTVAVWPLGGAGYVFKTPTTTIYVDPFVGEGTSPVLGGRAVPPPFNPAEVGRIDLVLCSHDHADHTDAACLQVWSRRLVPPVVGPQASIDLLRSWHYPDGRLRTLDHGQTTAINGVSITAVKTVDPLAKGTNGYAIVAEGMTLVHCGDSLYFTGLADAVGAFKVDVLFVSVAYNPPGKDYYMTEVDAARAARDVGARILVPGHWDLWQNLALDPRRVAVAARWYAPATEVKIPRQGRKLVFRASDLA